ncbi:replication-relaxation family protein [Streptomyces xanthophaeus]|uniref:replication-relaxation family protein n=1 Tax=Streptomyces xanthophaeus TaxID=67385 RepID=UPI00398FB9DE
MAGKRLTNPAGSSNDLRGDVLRVLGVLKVATADQIQRIASPHLTYRHTTKATASERKTARTASHAGALSDLRKHGLAENGGTSRAGESLRNLTTKGLEAASYELGRPLTEMGSTARGAGSSGATHPMAVTEIVVAMLRPKPDLRLLTAEPAEAKAAAQAAVDAPAGVGTIASYATEVPLPATGTWGAPGKGGAQADIVLTAPQDGIPLLFIEVDNCHETAEEIAAKLLKYSRFFKRQIKDTDGKDKPTWRTRWMASVAERGEAPHPPVLMVFNHIGARDPNRTVPRLQELTHPLWAGEPADGYSSYDRKIPIIPRPPGRADEATTGGVPGAAAPRGRAEEGRARGRPPCLRRLRDEVRQRPMGEHPAVSGAWPPVAPEAVRAVRGQDRRGRGPGRA